MEHKIIQQLEQVAMNALPAIHTLMYDGWVLRLSDGVTRRANSINPIFEPLKAAEEKIDFCEKLYRKHSLPVIFKMTHASAPSGLDAILSAKGYAFDAETSVQTLNLERFNSTHTGLDVSVSNQLEEQWLDRFLAFNGYDFAKKEGFRNIMKNSALEAAFLDFRVDGQAAGCGLGVIEGELIGLFDIVVAPEYKGKGYGKQLVESLIDYGKQKACRTAYLQVMTNNPVAMGLYEKIGFTEQYRYWYRVKA